MSLSILKTSQLNVVGSFHTNAQSKNKQTNVENFRTIISEMEKLSPDDKNLDYLQLASAMNLWKMSVCELIEAYAFLKTWNASSYSTVHQKEISKLIFEVRDCLIRLIAQDVQKQSEATQLAKTFPELQKDISRTNPNNQVFISLTKLTEAAAKGALIDNRPKHIPPSPRSLHVCVEYENAFVGGVGGVAISLLRKMNEAHHDARIVTPFYDLYQEDEKYKSAHFVGILKHEFDGKTVESSVYKIRQTGDVAHYMVKPDPSHTGLFDVKSPGNIFTDITNGSGFIYRSNYFTTAVAALASTYNGRKKQKNFDLVQFHTWTTALAAQIIKRKYHSLREKSGLLKVHSILHLHSGLKGKYQFHTPEKFKNLGIFNSKMNFHEEVWLHVDGVAFVSPVIESEALSPGNNDLYEVARNFHTFGRLASIMNGIDLREHSLISQKAHGTFTSTPVYNASGKDVTDYFTHKAKIKKALYKAGLVPDSEKPLFLFVGRFDPIKGIDKLQGIAEEIIKLGGQCVIMGWSNPIPSEILELQKIAEKHPQSMRVYTRREDQIDLFKDSGSSKGSLIRAASDFLLMPSKSEGTALVVWELIARGVLVISSMGGGLKAQCRDLNDFGENKFNSFNYVNDDNAKINAAQAIQRAMALYEEKTKNLEDWNQILRRLIKESSSYDWIVPGGPIEQLNNFYQKVMKPPSKTEIKKWDELLKAYYKKYSIALPNDDRIINKIKKLISRLF